MRSNPNIKTFIFLAALTALLVVVGYIISGTGGAIIFFMFSLLINIISYWFSDRLALSMAGAKPIAENQAPEIYQDVREISQKMNIPMPRVYYTEDMQPNAFATGRNPQNSAVCITKGLLNALNRNEVRGVIAHELAHIRNRDVLLSTIAAVIAGAISALAQIGMFFGSSNDDNNRSPIVDLLLILFAPIAATLIQLAISRSREFHADATAAQFTGAPKDLANALIKIDQSVRQMPFVEANPALSSLFIANPFSGTGTLLNLFSTHPPIEKRVERLMSM